MESEELLDTSGPEILTVSELNERIRDLVEEGFPRVWVVGEVSNLRQPVSGHSYFTLKDEGSQIRAVRWRSRSQQQGFDLENGQRVIVLGRIGVYIPRGEYQVIAERIEPEGIGALGLAFERLKKKLSDEGLFDEAAKRPLPFLPRRIGVVTSPTGAAVRDIIRIVRRRFVNMPILVYPAKVQGEGAAEEVAEGILALNEIEELDVIIIGRGGGSIEDLWAFNDETLAQTIRASRVPVVSAVGHETDFTIADFVADLRAPTPSAAAELTVPRKDELAASAEALDRRMRAALASRLREVRARLEKMKPRPAALVRVLDDRRQRLDDRWERAAGRMQEKLSSARSRLEERRARLRAASPRRRVQLARADAARLAELLARVARHALAARRASLGWAVAKLDALSPLAVLARGYAIVRRLPELAVVRDAAALATGDRVAIRFARGEARASIEKAEPAPKEPTG